MKKYTKLVLNILKPKVKSLGFSKEELEGIAADVANNLELDEEASDEDVNAEIENHIDAVVPYLKIAQKTAQRTIQRFRDSNDDNGENNDSKGIGTKNDQESHESEEKVPTWAQAIITQQKALQTELISLKADRTSDSRRHKLKSLLKDTGIFGKSTLKNFDKMKFENESEFDDFYDGIVEDLAAINQERANEGLGKLGVPTVQHQEKKDDVEVISDADIDKLAETM